MNRLDVDRVRRWIRFFAELKEDPGLGRAFEEALRNARRHAGPDQAS